MFDSDVTVSWNALPGISPRGPGGRCACWRYARALPPRSFRRPRKSRSSLPPRSALRRPILCASLSREMCCDTAWAARPLRTSRRPALRAVVVFGVWCLGLRIENNFTPHTCGRGSCRMLPDARAPTNCDPSGRRGLRETRGRVAVPHQRAVGHSGAHARV